MIKRILWYLFIVIIVALIAAWLWGGGIGKAQREAASYTSIIDVLFFRGSPTGVNFRLPWQPEFPTGVPIPVYGEGENGAQPQTLQEKVISLENQYNTLNAQANEAKTFGNPSPLRGQVRISDTNGAQTSDPRAEYLVIVADRSNTAPIDVTGWSLQSAYTGLRGYIPSGAPAFLAGVVNRLEDISLAPGDGAVVASGHSPVAVSFRENMCSGYLEQFQRFVPMLSSSCPSAASALPFTPENLRTYGDTCFDFLQNISACTTPIDQIPPNISSNCRSFALNTLTYNGCVSNNRYRSSFLGNTWRVYLDSDAELWRNSHDIIRLLDGNGQTVDVLTY